MRIEATDFLALIAASCTARIGGRGRETGASRDGQAGPSGKVNEDLQ
jgi:hypothetical protein